MPIEFSRAAENDLREIFRHGIDAFGLLQAERYKALLDRSFQTLSDNPNIARRRPDLSPAVRIYPTQKHIVVYTTRPDGRTVFVLRVRHQRENWIERPVGD